MCDRSGHLIMKLDSESGAVNAWKWHFDIDSVIVIFFRVKNLIVKFEQWNFYIGSETVKYRHRWDSDSLTVIFWQLKWDTEIVTVTIWQRQSDSEVGEEELWWRGCEGLTVKVGQWRFDIKNGISKVGSEDLTVKVRQWMLDSETVKVEAWQESGWWKFDIENRTVLSDSDILTVKPGQWKFGNESGAVKVWQQNVDSQNLPASVWEFSVNVD